MKRIFWITAILATLTAPVQAEEDTGKSLMEQGAELFFEGLRKEMEPAWNDLSGLIDQFGPAMLSFMEEMGPALAELGSQVKDWSAYEVPEMLPNGDIIIRKKQAGDVEPSEPSEPEQTEDDSETVTEI